MAFHPVQHFRKYQKVWMAGVLLLCMITFVLCTGVGGDLSEMLMTMLARRSGNLVAKVDGRNYYNYDFSELKAQRSLANEFMKKASEFYIKGIDNFLAEISKDPKKMKEEDQRFILPRLMGFKNELGMRGKKRWYFDSGVKLEELADFLMWKAQADRLGIKLVEDHVREMVRNELFQPWISNFSGHQIQTETGWLTFELRRDFPKANEATLFRALEDEFRVRMAQLALLQAQPEAYRERGPELKGGELIKAQMFDVPENERVRHVHEIRAVATPEQLWEQFKQKRAEFDVALVPVPVEYFLDKIKPPTEQELKSFFEEHKKLKYDPTSDKPGFEIPHRAKIGWVTADPESQYYKNLAKTAHTLMVTPPVAWNPWQSPVISSVRYALGRTPLDAMIYKGRQETSARGNYLAASLTDSDVLSPILDKLYKPTPASVVALVGSAFRDDLFAAVPLSYRSSVFVKHKEDLPRWLTEEANSRAPAYATLILGGATGSPLLPVTQHFWAERQHFAGQVMSGYRSRYLPLDVVRDHLINLVEQRLASEWARKNIQQVKKVLENPRLIGKSREVFELELLPLVEKYGLTRAETKEFHDRFSVSKSKELEPLQREYERWYEQINIAEGRGGTERALKEGDLHRLFFDSSEGFSTGVVLFDVRVWPAKVAVKDPRMLDDPHGPAKLVALSEDERAQPFLFWKTADEPAQPAESLASVRDRVERAWKIDKARQQMALPQAKEIAERLQKTAGVGPPLNLREEADKVGQQPIYLRNLAPIVMVPTRFGPKTVDYGEYKLPSNIVEYPRDDMVKHLLSLTDLKEEPIKIDNDKLNEVNKGLWQTTKNLPAKEGLGRQVQILTNKPRTVFYVATVSNPPNAHKPDFDQAVRQAVGMMGGPYDSFVRRAHDLNAKEYRQSIIAQLRNDAGWWISPDEVKQFDTDTAP